MPRISQPRESESERKGERARGLCNKYSVCISMSGGVSGGQGDGFLLVMRLLKRGNGGPEGAPLLLPIPRIPSNSQPTPQASAGVLSIFISLAIKQKKCRCQLRCGPDHELIANPSPPIALWRPPGGSKGGSSDA